MTGDDASGLEKLIGYIRQDVQNLDRKIDDRFDKMVSAEAFRAERERVDGKIAQLGSELIEEREARLAEASAVRQCHAGMVALMRRARAPKVGRVGIAARRRCRGSRGSRGRGEWLPREVGCLHLFAPCPLNRCRHTANDHIEAEPGHHARQRKQGQAPMGLQLCEPIDEKRFREAIHAVHATPYPSWNIG